ncbi:hypothetical protein MHH28_18405 [Paenibacillus sp. FSL K6-1217]
MSKLSTGSTPVMIFAAISIHKPFLPSSGLDSIAWVVGMPV